MTSAEVADFVIRALHEVGAPFMVTGSTASIVYSHPRSTADVDFVLENDIAISEIQTALKPHFIMDPQIGFETKFMTTKYVFLNAETKFKVELFLLSQDPHDQVRFARRLRVMKGELVTYLPTPEDVVIQKLRWGRSKDKGDVVDVLQVSGEGLDWPYIHAWCERHGTRPLLDELRREADEGM